MTDAFFICDEKDAPEYDFIRAISRNYQIPFRLESLDEGIRGYKIDNEIVINRHLAPERRNWTFCHELAHIVLGHSPSPNDYEEREADRYAADLMLPEREFIPDSAAWDLEKLKGLYPHASYETLARRCLQFRPAVMTIFDDGEITCRAGSESIVFPIKPAPLEIEVFQRCWEQKQHFEKSDEGLTVKGWFIDLDRAVTRVILITEPMEAVD